MRRGLTAVVVSVLALAGCGGSNLGPMQTVPCCSNTQAAVRAGRPFQFLVFPVANTSDSKAMTLRKVELVNQTPGVRLLGAYVLTQGGTTVIDPSFPAARAKRLDSVAGYVVPPRSGPERSVDVALRLVAHPGPEHLGAVAIDYHSAGGSYSTALPESMSVCASGPVPGTGTHIRHSPDPRRCDPVPDKGSK